MAEDTQPITELMTSLSLDDIHRAAQQLQAQLDAAVLADPPDAAGIVQAAKAIEALDRMKSWLSDSTF